MKLPNTWVVVIAAALVIVAAVLFLRSGKLVVRQGAWVEKARQAKIRHDLKMFIRAAELFKLFKDRYPRDLKELATDKIDGEELIPPPVPTDPWDREYLYRIVNGSPQVTCLGADGAEGGDGENKDYQETALEQEQPSSPSKP